jgi:hypothetical protein
MMDTQPTPAAPFREAQTTVERLVKLAVDGLPAMFDADRQLFCYKLKQTGRGLVQEGISQRYTMMTLLGLHRYEQAGGVSSIATEPVLNTLLADFGWVQDIGDLGVLLWLCGVVAPDRLAKIEKGLPIARALSTYPAAKKGTTMELAWFLTGISYWALAFPNHKAQLEGLALATHEQLKKNQGERGFFGHLSTSSSLKGFSRGRIGSFADQVYPIYGMTQFSQAFGHGEAAERAMLCARGICEVQGPKGQWWWHYDASGGQVVDGYPVFSVHQHAMGPMTLFRIGEASGQDFRPWIYKGLEWINSRNELGFEMEDDSAKLVWRCIQRSQRSLGRYLNTALGRYSRPVQHDNAADLEVLFECRPYELGWLLYAFAGRGGHARGDFSKSAGAAEVAQSKSFAR